MASENRRIHIHNTASGPRWCVQEKGWFCWRTVAHSISDYDMALAIMEVLNDDETRLKRSF